MTLCVTWSDGRVERMRARDGATVTVGDGDVTYETWLHGDDDELICVVVRGDGNPTMTLEMSK